MDESIGPNVAFGPVLISVSLDGSTYGYDRLGRAGSAPAPTCGVGGRAGPHAAEQAPHCAERRRPRRARDRPDGTCLRRPGRGLVPRQACPAQHPPGFRRALRAHRTTNRQPHASASDQPDSLTLTAGGQRLAGRWIEELDAPVFDYDVGVLSRDDPGVRAQTAD